MPFRVFFIFNLSTVPFAILFYTKIICLKNFLSFEPWIDLHIVLNLTQNMDKWACSNMNLEIRLKVSKST